MDKDVSKGEIFTIEIGGSEKVKGKSLATVSPVHLSQEGTSLFSTID
jgi:hypothetical protein